MLWDTVIGLEVHAQLKTKSKLFSSAPTQYGATANTQTSYIDAGLPGVLPVLNQEVIHMSVLFGLAINATINQDSYFERKNYFYPDLPKGYQISQFQCPIVHDGILEICLEDGKKKPIHIARAHLEEDAGKSIHDAMPEYTGIDLNRAGTPLLEIVTTPCIHNATEATIYLKTLHQLLRFLDICDGNMQEGSFRCDVNLSLKPKDSPHLGTRVELKNLNSFRFIEKAIEFEIARQRDCLENGETIAQETRLYSPENNATYAMRGKETSHDYRYFPDPDLLPIQLTENMLNQIRANIPALPQQLREQLQHDHTLAKEDIDFLLSTPALVNYYLSIRKKTRSASKQIVNWLKGNYTAVLNERGIGLEKTPITAENFACLLDRIEDNIISPKIAKILLSQLVDSTQTVDELIKSFGYQTVNDEAMLQTLIQTLIQNFPEQVAAYQAGKEKLFAFFVGQVMKKTKGQADPSLVNKILLAQLKNN